MEDKLDQLKAELVQEIKNIAEEIAKSNSYVGLLSQETKFKTLHEKFINLKFLERKHIGLDIFDQPIPPKDDLTEDIIYAEDRFEDETPKEYSFDRDELTYKTHHENGSNVEQRFELTTDDDVSDDDAWIDKQEKSQIIEDDASLSPNDMDEVENKNPMLEKEKQTTTFDEEINQYAVNDLETYLPKSSSLPKIQVDFNDKMAFQYQLFNGDTEAMVLVLEHLNQLTSLSDSKAYIKDLIIKNDWSGKEEYIERLQELIHKRFD